MNTDAHRLAARLLMLDHNRRTIDAEGAEDCAVRIDRIIAEADLEALVRGLLDVLASADAADSVGRLIARGLMATYADGDVLLDEILGRRPTAGRDQ